MTPFDASKRAVARQANARALVDTLAVLEQHHGTPCREGLPVFPLERRWCAQGRNRLFSDRAPVSYTHLRAHETVLDLVCRLLLEKKNTSNHDSTKTLIHLDTRNHTKKKK